MDGSKGVMRAGARRFGVYAEGGGRLIESVKGVLLTEVGGPGEAQARRDFEDYVRALGKTWDVIREREGIEYARFVLTVPWSYTKEITTWYTELVRKHFKSVVLVTTVREAESAA